MVLTGAVRMSGTGHTRRTVLAAGLGVTTALAGCEGEPPPPPVPDPLLPVLDEALALAAAYDRAVVAQPGLASRLTPLAEDHRAHAAELARTIGTAAPSAAAPSASASAPATTATPAELRTAEQAAQKNAVVACQAAPAARAALLGSIAACRATHAEALR